MSRMAGDVLTQQAAPFMAVLADPRATREQQELAAIQLSELMNPSEGPPGSDPRDYRVESGLWRSQLLPLGVTIDQAIRDGAW